MSKFILGHENPVFYDVFMIVAQLSFIYAVFSLFSIKKFLLKKIFPGIKFSVYSLILMLAAVVFSLPCTFIVKIFIKTTFFPLAIPVVTYCYGFIKALVITGVLFSIFNFIEKPSIDQPILNALDIFTNNTLILFIVSVITAVLFIAVPVLSKDGYSFIFRMFFCIIFIAVYLALKPEENGAAAGEQENAKSPKIKISI
ncbi:MAG: hypothetical protein LBL00_04755 [Endomicrobium sp.]|nr:hypothetical protein [Endomicrobium sp.]